MEFTPEHTPKNASLMACGFLDCAEWLLDEDTDRDSIKGWSTSAIAHAEKVCAKLEADHGALLDAYREATGRDDEQVGHDLWLTIEESGSSFDDRDEATGEPLDVVVRDSVARCEAYLGDDGFLYLYGTEQ